MSEMNFDLKELERRAFKATFQDGLWDIYLGLMLLPMTIWFVLVIPRDLPDILVIGTMMVLLLLPYLGFWLSKKYVVAPRLGYVRFGKGRQKKRKKIGLVLSLSVMISAILVIMTATATIPELAILPLWTVPVGIMGIKLIIVFSLLAYYLDFPRAYLYGWFYALAIVELVQKMGTEAAYIVLAPLFALVMIILGSILFIRFLRSHPSVKKEVKFS